MNCFHFSYFCSLKTALTNTIEYSTTLWIAFIFRTFALWKQLKKESISILESCELLSFFVLLLFENSWLPLEDTAGAVVNCFHFSYFCSLKTALGGGVMHRVVLWIAFIFRTFALWKQQKVIAIIERGGCELLSFFVLLLFENSNSSGMLLRWYVVNCFHFSYFCSLKTAQQNKHSSKN